MDRITGAGYVLDAKGNRSFEDENLVAGVRGTDVSAAFMIGVQEELCGGIERLGGVCDPANNGQFIGKLIDAFPGLEAPGRSIGTGQSGATGFLVLPGGIIVQWVRNKTAIADGSGAVVSGWVFPKPFTTVVGGYSYTNTNEDPSNTPVGILQAGKPTLAAHPIVHLSCPPGAQVAFSGFVIGV